jgi:hypothetical protein
MSTRSFLAVGAVASAALLAAALPASADPGNATDTTVTFSVVGGGISISAPTFADLGSTSIGGESIMAQLGTVTVNDQRGALAGSWNAVVGSTNFTTGGGSPGETIPNYYISYFSGPAYETYGAGVFTPGQLFPNDAVPLDLPVIAFSAYDLSGPNGATWNPGLIVNVPPTATTGVYTGTITHSIL